MSKKKLPHPFSWYYKSFEIDNKCPFCGSETIYSTRNNDVLYCNHYATYVSTYDCESQMGETGTGGCKACSFEPAKFCPIAKTSIAPSDCEGDNNFMCKKCDSSEMSLPRQGELRRELVWVCDDCQKVVDFSKLKVSDMYPSS